jgi:hypothetical protein
MIIFFYWHRGRASPPEFIKGLWKAKKPYIDGFSKKAMETERRVQHQGTTRHFTNKTRTKHDTSSRSPLIVDKRHHRKHILANSFMALAPCTAFRSYTTPLLPSI